MRKPAFCICKNKAADQLRHNGKADQCLCFCYTDSTIPQLPKSEISSIQPSSVVVQPGLCQTWSETPKTGFHVTRLISPVCTPSVAASHQFGNPNKTSFLAIMLNARWRSGAVVRASDFGPRGPWFKPRLVHISLWP